MAGEGTGNNYAYLVSDEKTSEAVIIDPAHPPESVTLHIMLDTSLHEDELESYPCSKNRQNVVLSSGA